MTVQECISDVDSIEPNAYTNTQKAGWLSECEGKVYASLFLVQPYEFTPITAADSRILALPAPYDRMYPRYLQAMIHYANGEYDRYANSMAAFNEVWAEANRWFGGDYDVTDRLRSRSFSAEIGGEIGPQIVMTVPEGCAIVAGRLMVENPYTLSGSSTVQAWFDTPANTLGASVSLAQHGSAQLPMLIADRGGTNLGVTMGPGAWTEEGTVYLTGKLLIPDEEWIFRNRKKPSFTIGGGPVSPYTPDLTKIPVTINIPTLSALPYVVEDERITENHVVFETELGNPGAQGGPWTVTTEAGKATISGTLLGTTSLKLVLGISA